MQYLNPKNPLKSAFLYGEQKINWSQVMADVADLTLRLPKNQFVINICENRYHFFVGLLAAIQQQCITLLPPNRLEATLVDLQQHYNHPICLHDQQHICADLPSIECQYQGKTTIDTYEQITVPHDDQVIFIAFTSGTTGKPKPFQKTWGSLSKIAQRTCERLTIDSNSVTVVATVPPQHMFGFETSIMLPWLAGFTIDSSVPFFPQDIKARCDANTDAKIVVSTPTHLHILARDNVSIANIKQVISATSSLSKKLAQTIESKFSAQLFEIYGSTETGTLATRFSTQTTNWQTLPHVRLSSAIDGIEIFTDYFSQPILLHDHVQLFAENQFKLIGRGQDIIKIAGKRISLTALNNILCSIDGVEDGVFYLPETDETPQVTRLVALVVAPNSDEHKILKALRKKIEPSFLPRPLILIPYLPRDKVGKLPHYALKKLWQEASCEQPEQIFA